MRRRDLPTALMASTLSPGLTQEHGTGEPCPPPCYPRTESEIAAGTVPRNYHQPPGNPRRYGALGNGTASDRSALVAQAATGDQMYLTRGVYLIDADLTLACAIWCEHGAIFRVLTGVVLSLTGPFDGTKSQHFELEGTGKVEFGSATNQWPYEAVVPICPEYWGAASATIGDSTAAVQASFDCNRDVRFYQDYSVSQIVLTGNELHIDFAGFSLIGNAQAASFAGSISGNTLTVTQIASGRLASGAVINGAEVGAGTQIIRQLSGAKGGVGTYALDVSQRVPHQSMVVVGVTSVLDIKCGYSTLRDVCVDADFNPLYACAVHWYTNNLNLHNPSFNRIYGLWPKNALIGLCIGGLPGQKLPLPPQGAVVPTGLATNAPVSESTIFGFQSSSCVRSVWISQANGKLTMVGATVIGSHAGWKAFGDSGYTSASTCALTIDNESGQFSELHLSGGSLEQNSEPKGLFIQLRNAHLYCTGTILEAVCSSYFSGQVGASFRDCMNFGFNFPDRYVPFLITPTCSGWMNISGGKVNFPPPRFGEAAVPFAMGAATSADAGAGGLAVNYGRFVVSFDRIELENIPFGGVPRYVPLCQGVKFLLSHCLLANYKLASRTTAIWINDSDHSLLDGCVDVSNHSIVPFAANGDQTSGGWRFTVSSADLCKWGREQSGLTVEGSLLPLALRLSSGPVGTFQGVTATSSMMNVRPQNAYRVHGWIKCSGRMGGKIQIRAVNFKFDGSVSENAPYSDFLSCRDDELTQEFQQLAAYVLTPSDTTKIQLVISALNGADVALCGLELR